MGNDLAKGTTYASGGIDGQGTITPANLNAHVDDATIKASFVSSKVERTAIQLDLTESIVVEKGGSLYRMLLPSIIPDGAAIQTVAATPYTANTDLTAIIPAGDVIPQITAGTQILSLTITPRFFNSQIRLTSSGFGSVSIVTGMAVALFRVGLANCLQAYDTVPPATGGLFRLPYILDWIDAPGVTTPTTYTVRAGPNTAATMRMNGAVTARIYGGAAACTLVAQEIKRN